MATKAAVNRALKNRGLALAIEKRGRHWFLCNSYPYRNPLWNLDNPHLHISSLAKYDLSEVIHIIARKIEREEKISDLSK